MSLGVLRGVVLVVCVGGIAGMIIGTVATDNNNGVVITFGIITAIAMLTLIVATTVARGAGGDEADAAREHVAATVDDTLAAEVEARIASLVEAGTDEAALRALVGDAVKLGRSAR